MRYTLVVSTLLREILAQTSVPPPPSPASGSSWMTPEVIVAGIAAIASIVALWFAHRAIRQATFANGMAQGANELAEEANRIAKQAIALEEERNRVRLIISVASDYREDEGSMQYRFTVRNMSDKEVPLRSVRLASSKTGQGVEWSRWDDGLRRSVGPDSLKPRSEQEFKFIPLLGGFDYLTLQTLDTLSVETQAGERFDAPADKIGEFRRAAESSKRLDEAMRKASGGV